MWKLHRTAPHRTIPKICNAAPNGIVWFAMEKPHHGSMLHREGPCKSPFHVGGNPNSRMQKNVVILE